MPLDISPPALAGSFGELRANHFHSGADFRTNQREGYPVYAVADGYVSRLRVQNSGFGLALYLVHPNGFTTVYGHLQRFAPKIAREVKTLQYSKKSYELDEFPKADLLPVRKGEVIAYSGNTGGSGGPHLHFEVRDSRTEETINPQLFGIDIPDNIPPVLSAMYVYRLNGKPFNESTPRQYFQLSGGGGSYRLHQVNTIRLSGEVGFGIITTDKHNGASGTNGVYSIQLFVDNVPVYTSALERFSFANSKGINSHIDYPVFLNQRRSIQKSFIDPGNPLKIYSNVVNNGRIVFDDGRLHRVRYEITDAKGNQTRLEFSVQAGAKNFVEEPPEVVGQQFRWNTKNELNTGDVRISIPRGSLYDDITFVYKTLPKPAKGAYSAIHQVHNRLTPLHSGFDLAIRADSSLYALRDKALIVSTGGASQGGIFENGFVRTSPRSFGGFYIAVDTVAPRIVPLNIAEGKNMAGLARISFRISDNLAGIKSFNGYIDGKWVLFEFDAKTASLWYRFDENIAPGKHTLELAVTDMKDNVRRYRVGFTR
ncbi:M23 family peptidase [Pedobacter yulinensis]|uniref:M23 family peptidase n=2 Tax=Pedobacter yulinensis TaxID=2126353 RepID=A0A2T3HJ92_9SPHI|nr:M23 family peptidase [Pedobacter yulinensis]